MLVGLNCKEGISKVLHLEVSFYVVGTWTHRKVDHKCHEGFEMWCWRRREKIIWSDRVKKEEVLHTDKEQRNILYTIKKFGLVIPCVGTTF
jgi:hypothetical protein